MTTAARKLLKHLCRRFRDPIIRFLAQGDLIIVGDVWVTLDADIPTVFVDGDVHCRVFGSIGVTENPPGLITAPGQWRP